MARPASEGLDYFSLDTDMDADDKIEFIEAKYGLVAFGIIVRLLMYIYRNGYYMTWSERQQFVFSKRVNVDINTLSEIVNVCINEEIFSKELFEKYGVLTSHGIQCRYLRACERRKSIQMISEYCLVSLEDGIKLDNISYKNINVDINTTSSAINVDINSSPEVVNVDTMSAKTTQSKVKESKYISTTTTGASEPQNSEVVDETDLAEIYKIYSDNIHPVAGQIEAEKIHDLLSRFGKVWLIASIERAVNRNKRSLGYIEGILKNWGTNGFDNGDDANGKSTRENTKSNSKPKNEATKQPNWDNFYKG